MYFVIKGTKAKIINYINIIPPCNIFKRNIQIYKLPPELRYSPRNTKDIENSK